MLADGLDVVGGPDCEQLHGFWVQRNEAVIAELADGDPQPVAMTDADHGVGLDTEAGRL